MPASYRTRSSAIYVNHLRGFSVMLKSVLLKGKYYYHLFQYRHIEMMQHDCLCEELKCELKVKSLYHNSKAIELGARI